MVLAREATNERSDADGPRRAGRPRDAAIDDAIIMATRQRLVSDGYSRMTIGDIAADAKVSRPALYRRWSTKFELVIDAVDYGFREQRDLLPFEPSGMAPREALVAAVRRLDPAYFDPDAMVLLGNFAGEVNRTPGLLEALRRHAVEPRVTWFENVLSQLQDDGVVRGTVDKRTISRMCVGSYFVTFYRGENKEGIPEAVVAALWPAIAASTTDSRGVDHPAHT